jgi:hypothetical protein
MEDLVRRAIAEASPQRRVEHGGNALELIVGELGAAVEGDGPAALTRLARFAR